MLTRAQAKKQSCPLMPVAKTYESHPNTGGVSREIIEYHTCRGEGCPRWQDGKTDGKNVPMTGSMGTPCTTAIPAPNATATAEADHARIR